MNQFTNAELTIIHIVYVLSNRNGRVANRLYWERYPMRRQPNPQMFALVYQNIVERESFRATMQNTSWPRTARIPIMEEGLLHSVDRSPASSVGALAAGIGTSRSTFHRVLQGKALNPFHVQRAQLLR